MKLFKLEIKEGVLIMVMGLVILVFCLANKSLAMLEKVVLTVICVVFIVFGVLVETPILEHLREGQDQMQEDFV